MRSSRSVPSQPDQHPGAPDRSSIIDVLNRERLARGLVPLVAEPVGLGQVVESYRLTDTALGSLRIARIARFSMQGVGFGRLTVYESDPSFSAPSQEFLEEALWMAEPDTGHYLILEPVVERGSNVENDVVGSSMRIEAARRFGSRETLTLSGTLYRMSPGGR